MSDLDLDAVASDHQPDYDSIGGCVCAESYPCTTLSLIAEVRALRERVKQSKNMAETVADATRREIVRLEAERDALRERFATLEGERVRFRGAINEAREAIYTRLTKGRPDRWEIGLRHAGAILDRAAASEGALLDASHDQGESSLPVGMQSAIGVSDHGTDSTTYDQGQSSE